jgi:hypothetical protein
MNVGDKVRVMTIPDWLLRDIPEDERGWLKAQLGQVVEIRANQGEKHLWLAFVDGSEGFVLEREDVSLIQEP